MALAACGADVAGQREGKDRSSWSGLSRRDFGSVRALSRVLAGPLQPAAAGESAHRFLQVLGRISQLGLRHHRPYARAQLPIRAGMRMSTCTERAAATA